MNECFKQILQNQEENNIITPPSSLKQDEYVVKNIFDISNIQKTKLKIDDGLQAQDIQSGAKEHLLSMKD